MLFTTGNFIGGTAKMYLPPEEMNRLIAWLVLDEIKHSGRTLKHVDLYVSPRLETPADQRAMRQLIWWDDYAKKGAARAKLLAAAELREINKERKKNNPRKKFLCDMEEPRMWTVDAKDTCVPDPKRKIHPSGFLI